METLFFTSFTVYYAFDYKILFVVVLGNATQSHKVFD